MFYTAKSYAKMISNPQYYPLQSLKSYLYVSSPSYLY